MQLKPITAIIVLSLVVASLLIAGCTTSTTSNTASQTPSVSATPYTGTHDAFLEKMLESFKNRTYSDKNYSIMAWGVTWINSTSARVNISMEDNTTTSTNITLNYVMTFTAFPTTQDATNYLNAMNTTAYKLTSTQCLNSTSGGAFKDATGHDPQICKDYERTEGSSSNISEYRLYHIFQTDNLIIELTGRAFHF